MDLENFDIEKEAPTLTALGKANPFTVPDHYFGDLKGMINSRVFISDLIKEDGFSVPKEYFEELAERTKTAVFAHELKAASFDTGFSVPENYFEGLKENILAKTGPAEPQKSKTKRFGLWISYAAAASVTLFAGISLYLNIHTKSLEYQLNQIPDQDIINYLQLHADEGDTYTIIENLPDAGLKDIDQVSDDDVKEYIEQL